MRVLQEYDKDGRDSQLREAGWFQDIPKGHETFDIDSATNDPFVQRHSIIQDSRIVDLYGPVILGPLRQNQAFVGMLPFVCFPLYGFMFLWC